VRRLLCARSHGGHGQTLGGRRNFSTLKGRVGIMNKATMKWRLALPVAAADLVLGGCGGSGDDSTDAVVSSSGSINACFTVNDTVSYAVTASNVPVDQTSPTRSTVGPMIYNGQTVTGQKLFYPSGNTTYIRSNYWTVTSNGVTVIALVDYDGTATTDGTFFPQNMNPGQTSTNPGNDVTTFVGFEKVTLAGKTFANTCHIKEVAHQGIQADSWYAPGYGMIQNSINNGITWQYNGDL
jgi:hypothetical protein